jgi:hypothetical protein
MFALALLLAMDPAPKTKILVLDLEANGIDPDRAKLVNSLLPGAVARYPDLEVVSAGDVRKLVQLDADKQSAGCNADSCLAELAGALGAQRVVFGSIGSLGALTVIQLSLFDTKAATAVARERIENKTPEELPTQLDNAVATLLGRAQGTGPSALVTGGFIGAGAGAVIALASGAYAFVLDDRLTHAATSGSDKHDALAQGPWFIGASAVGAVIAVGLGAASGIGLAVGGAP